MTVALYFRIWYLTVSPKYLVFISLYVSSFHAFVKTRNIKKWYINVLSLTLFSDIYKWKVYQVAIYIYIYIVCYCLVNWQDEDQRQSTKVYTQPVSLMLFFKCVQRLPFYFTYLTLSTYHVMSTCHVKNPLL